MSKSVRIVVMFIVGVILFVGLPLIGWGITDAQGFIANPARLAYILLVIVLQAVIVIRFPRVGQQQGEGTKTVQRQRFAVVLLQILSIAIILAAPYTDRRAITVLTSSDIVRYVGLILFGLGFYGVNWVESVLGKQFSVQVTIQSEHQLITEGPYRYIRNPRYLGIIVFNLGVALAFNSGLPVLLVAALLGVLLWRIHDEEALMHQTFGAAWKAYSKHSWHLIPYVY